jgi:hypothetical protein
MDDLPRPAVVVATAPGLSAVPIGLGALGLAGLVIGSVAGRWPAQRRITFVGAGVVLSVLAFAFSQVGVAPASQPVLSSQQAGAVVEVLHTNLYRAFDYTADSDVYDRLALSVDGDLLSTLYEQIKLSLLQAEEDMKVGVVTGLDHESTEVTAIDSAGDHGLGGFDATLRWRVDGTVYHWGHSHTRVHEYEAAYRVDWLEDGWRITGQQLLSQERIDPGATADRLDPLQQMLQQLGTPDI